VEPASVTKNARAARVLSSRPTTRINTPSKSTPSGRFIAALSRKIDGVERRHTSLVVVFEK
jgi:hypothetical protein